MAKKQAKLDDKAIKGRDVLIQAMKEVYDAAAREGFQPRGRSLDSKGIDLAKDCGVDLFWVTWEVTPHVLRLHLYRERYGAHSDIGIEIAPDDDDSLYDPGVITEVSWKMRAGQMDAPTAVARAREHLDAAELLCGIDTILKSAAETAGRAAAKDREERPFRALVRVLPAIERSQEGVWSLLRDHARDYDSAKDV